MSFDAHVCENGHVTYPGHTLCPECGAKQTERLDLAERTGEVVTWTKSTATPPGVRAPNTIAIVQFDLSGEDLADDYVRAVGQVTTEEVETGDAVEPVYAEELRDPEAGIKVPESQEWDGYRFEPV
ncbi:Zn-ribbon domain-containing OB-fold protein [Halosimplex marinum]|uniref:Zn-ribbon domain-containing OB-fold protein n=1 Tax=Halosimplex marinum TaxID=3396620 RepID=UPI003F559BD0